MAGVGNIYASDALNLARLSPRQRASAIATKDGRPRPAAHRLAAAIKKVLLRAIDRQTGTERWDTTIVDYRQGYSSTAAPLALRDKVVVGVGGGDLGARGVLSAYDPRTGEPLWRFWTVPGPGEAGHETWAGDSWKTGGALPWVTGSYDPDLNVLYWGTGNPGPDYNGDDRQGDNLYSSSLLALDPDTGRLRWHFQFTPHDVHDRDSAQVPVLVDQVIGGRRGSWW